MLRCKSEEAGQYKCCTMDKQCEGDECMAWRDAYIPDPQGFKEGYRHGGGGAGGMSSPPPPMRKSGLGYCGLVGN